MGNNNKSLLTQSLKRIKEKHGLTIESWAEKANVPESTVARYLSSSLNIPNFPYVCAMLKSVNESIDTFYDSIDKKIDDPVDALKLDAVPTAVVGDVVVDTPETAAAIQERIIIVIAIIIGRNAHRRLEVIPGDLPNCIYFQDLSLCN